MKSVRFYISLLIFPLVLVACKGDTKNPDSDGSDSESVTQTSENNKENEQVTNSVFRKAMTTQELKTFVSATISAGITDLLMKDEGPYTLMAPSSDAFDQIPQEDMNVLLNPANKSELELLLKNHIIGENLSSGAILQAIKKNDSVTYTTLGGAKVTAFLQDNDILLKDASGKVAYIGKSDINGSNGTIHILTDVLNVD